MSGLKKLNVEKSFKTLINSAPTLAKRTGSVGGIVGNSATILLNLVTKSLYSLNLTVGNKVNHEATPIFTEYDRLTQKFNKLNKEMGEIPDKTKDPVKVVRILGEMEIILRDLSNPETYLRFDIQIKKK